MPPALLYEAPACFGRGINVASILYVWSLCSSTWCYEGIVKNSFRCLMIGVSSMDGTTASHCHLLPKKERNQYLSGQCGWQKAKLWQLSTGHRWQRKNRKLRAGLSTVRRRAKGTGRDPQTLAGTLHGKGRIPNGENKARPNETRTSRICHSLGRTSETTK